MAASGDEVRKKEMDKIYNPKKDGILWGLIHVLFPVKNFIQKQKKKKRLRVE